MGFPAGCAAARGSRRSSSPSSRRSHVRLPAVGRALEGAVQLLRRRPVDRGLREVDHRERLVLPQPAPRGAVHRGLARLPTRRRERPLARAEDPRRRSPATTRSRSTLLRRSGSSSIALATYFVARYLALPRPDVARHRCRCTRSCRIHAFRNVAHLARWRLLRGTARGAGAVVGRPTTAPSSSADGDGIAPSGGRGRLVVGDRDRHRARHRATTRTPRSWSRSSACSRSSRAVRDRDWRPLALLATRRRRDVRRALREQRAVS